VTHDDLQREVSVQWRISYTHVQASSAGHAKQLVLAQYGGTVTVLSVERA
jgi:hypothetical protein